MQIEEKYELLEPIAGLGGTQDVTVPAWERASGRLVFVHVLTGGYAAETSQVLTALGRLAIEHKQHVLGAGDLSGSAYVVTDALPWGASLRTWVASVSGTAPSSFTAPVERPADEVRFLRAGAWKIPVIKPGDPPSPAVPAAAPEPGGFTGGMRAAPPAGAPAGESPVEQAGPGAGLQTMPVAVPTPSSPKGESQASTPAAAAPPAEPGEFTRLMQAGKAVPEGMAGGVPQAPHGPTAPATPEPGEFTRLMQAGKPITVAATRSPDAAPPASEVGEFTRLMQAPNPMKAPKVDPDVTAEMAAAGSAEPASAAPSAGPGEFTRLMQAAKPAAPATLAPAKPETSTPPVEPGEFTRLMNADRPAPMPTAQMATAQFASPAAPSNPPASPAAGELPWRYDTSDSRPSPLQPAAAGPGEFTRMFQTPPAAAPAIPPLSGKPAGEGEYTRMLRAPSAPAENLFTAPPLPPAADVFEVRSGAVERDEFSHLASGSKPPQQPAPSAKAAAAPTGKTKSSNLPVVLIVGGLLLLALVVVIVFAVIR
ncbi:MAG TPA: hypothetical protein VNY05_28350 [Candidatus Acidoferrales bacterium]|jgi:hypothetical protein|nr:hypothetical protein [Candidatus Acidoferrales bacterium]